MSKERIIEENDPLKLSEGTGYEFTPITPKGELTPLDYPLQELGELEPVAKVIAEMAQEFEAMPAQCVLGVLALATQDLYEVNYLEHLTAPTSLFLLTIGVSGQRKSTVYELAAKPIREVEQKRIKTYDRELARYEANERKPKDQRSELLEPQMKYLTVANITLSGLISTYEQGSNSIGIFSDEAGTFLGGIAMGKDEATMTASTLSNTWKSGRFEVTRQKTNGTKKMANRWLSVHLMGQPKIVMPLLNDDVIRGQGFLARFLYCYAPTTMGTDKALYRHRNKSIDKQPLHSFYETIKHLLTAKRADTKYQVNVPDRIKMMFGNFNDELEPTLAVNGEYRHIADYVRKLTEHAARLAANIAIYEHWLDKPMAEPENITMTKEQAIKGIQLARYYLHEYNRLSNPDLGKDYNQEALDFFSMLKNWKLWESNDHLTIGKIRDQSRKDKDELNKLLTILVEHNYLIVVRTGKTMSYKLNPALQTL